MKSTINLNSINRSLSGLSESVKNANERSEKISDNIRDRNLAKKKSISMSAEFFAKRRDNQRRKEKEVRSTKDRQKEDRIKRKRERIRKKEQGRR